MTFVDANTFETYAKNMGQIMMEKITNADLLVFNRCTDELKAALRKRNLRMVNRRADIYLEDLNGNSEDYNDGEVCPFDLNQPVINIPDDDYGVWYVDVMDYPDRWAGKTVHMKLLMCHSKKYHRYPLPRTVRHGLLGQEPDQSAIRQFVKGTRLVTGVSVRRSRVELTLNVRFGNPNQVEKLAEAVAAVVEFLHASGYDNCCQNCGSAVETDPCIMTGVPSLLCDSCYQQLGHLQEQNQQAELGKTENMVAGTVGALLGSLLGVACIVLLGQLGYVAAVSGIVMAICTMKGYELLGGTGSPPWVWWSASC